MVVTFPHMGTMNIVLNALFSELGCEVLEPPATSGKTMELGARFSPETVCLPFKMTLGNFIEALDRGADTIITCGGVGPCRLGYYAAIQQTILEQQGYKFRMLTIEPDIVNIFKTLKEVAPNKSWLDVYKAFKLAGAKMSFIDDFERELHVVRSRAIDRMSVNKIRAEAHQAVQKAANCKSIELVREEYMLRLGQIKLSEHKHPLRVAIVGEIFVMLEPFVNQNLEESLGDMGVEVSKTMLLSDYVRGHLLRRRGYQELYRRLFALSDQYLGHTVGGHAQKSIAYTIWKKQQGYDGVIQIYPFTCMPEVIAKNILPQVSKDVDIPVLTLAFDEQTGEAGVRTRLEAFIDLLKYRKRKEAENMLPTRRANL